MQAAHITVVDQTKQYALQFAILKQHYGSFLLAVPARVGLAVCLFSQPFIVYRAVDIVGHPNATEAQKHGLILATALVYAGIAVSRDAAHLSL